MRCVSRSSSTRSRSWQATVPRPRPSPHSARRGDPFVVHPRVSAAQISPELDTKFHEGLVSLIGNETLVKELKAINERLFVFRMIDFDRANRVESTCVQHLNVLNRIVAKDVDGARAAMRMNIEEGRNIVHERLKDALARAYALI